MPTIVNTQGYPTPYITVRELKQSPVYSELKQLVPGQSESERDAQLDRIIMRASSMINAEVFQNLAATVDTEAGEVVVTPQGDLQIHTLNSHIIEVLSISIGQRAGNLTPVQDLSRVLIETWAFLLPGGLSDVRNNLPGVYSRPGVKMWAQWTYINGYPTTVLTAPTLVGDTSMIVKDPTGIKAGKTMLTIEDGSWLEQVVPSAVTGNILTVPPLQYPHVAGIGATELPDAIKEAVLLLISRLHDTWSLTMNAVSTDGNGARRRMAMPAVMCDAGYMLRPYRRMW